MPDIPITGDVVVIGAGLSGALIAHHLAEADLRVVVLEARRVAGRGTGEGDRVAYLGTPTPYSELAAELGEVQARHRWEATLANLEEARRVLERVDLPYRRCGSLRLATTTEEAYTLQRSAQALTELGFQVEIEDATSLGFVAAMATEDDLLFDPVALTHHLLDHPRITVQDRTEVHALKRHGEDIVIWAQRAYLRSHAAIIAAGAYGVHLDAYLAHHLRVMPIQAVDCKPGERFERPLLWEEGRISLQPPLDDGTYRLVAWVRSADEAIWPLVDHGASLFCPQSTLAGLWASWLAEGEDGLPLVGELPGTSRLYTISGLGGWGLSWVFLAARQLATLMIEGTEPTMMGTGRFRD